MSVNLNLSRKIFLQGVSIIACFAAVQIWVFLEVKGKIYSERINSIKNPVELSYTLITEYNERVNKGEFSLEEGKKRATMRIQNLRYNEKDYFWINDLGPRMIMHPYKPELNGKDLSDNKDPSGKRIFVEFVNVCKEKGEGVVEYMWPKHEGTKPVAKLSYVKLFKPWGWIVGTGVYLDDINKDLARLSFIILGMTILVGLGGLVFAFFMSRSITKLICLPLMRPSRRPGQGLQARVLQ